MNELLDYLPHKPPFRFIDEIMEVNDQMIKGSYTYKKDEYFYQGHFPQIPITPGVILIETMVQIGVASHAIYFLKEKLSNEKWTTIFTDVEVDFLGAVYPEEKVIVTGEKIFWRKNKLRSKVEMFNQKGIKVCEGFMSGMGVKF